ncbi:glycine oxidase ThiO [Anoxybacteroides tepidamans]|uniref:glycine oxidase ThiO n=1 Tax=Anoxybacteroides tepidamans TaxID=265948 RepID=UPI000489A8DD|nr:glycine oxidase ThiO [Anoxybacillus tepidamans]
MNGRHYDVAIIGGGIIGGSIAFELAKRRMKVVVLEKDRAVSQASSAAAGMLGAQSEFSSENPLVPMALKSRSMFPKLAEELKELTGIDIGYIEKGMLKVATTDEERMALKQQYEFWTKIGQPVQWLSPDELRQHEPNVNQSLLGVMYIPRDGQISAPHLSQAFVQASMIHGAEWYEFTEVIDIKREEDSYKLLTNQGIIRAEAVVAAAGAWTGLFLEKTGCPLPMFPVKGECLLVKTAKPLIQATIFAKNGCYIVPKKGNRLLIGATSTPNTFDKKVTVHGISSLLERAMQLVQGVGGAEWERTWAGIRPQTGDGLPYIGEHPHYRNMWIATGHYRNGILLSPITGILMADLIERRDHREIDLSPFSVKRHNGATCTT